MPNARTEAQSPAAEVSYANRCDRSRAEALARRAADWRNGAVIYQVMVDRFAPTADIEAKRQHYARPRRLLSWDQAPTRGEEIAESGLWSHELDFWGGDLASLMGKLDHVADLGADVLYLNPIQQALTNHKYDAQDYFAVAPEYGTRDDVKRLADALHARGMRLVLDGVFNHMGRTAPWFTEALADPQSPYRDWFVFDKGYPGGYSGWADVENLPELRLENPNVRARIYGDPDSVVQGYLRDGVDGWRLDVATDLGFVYLSELTEAAHAARPGSLVVGENWVYPEEWMPALDGVMNFYYRELLIHMLAGEVSGAHVGRLIECMIADTGLESVLKSWIILDNHDTARIKSLWPAKWQRRMAQVLQFTLPGSPCVYYGVEVGMDGADDPLQRGPMRWDLLRDDNPEWVWMRRLRDMRQSNRALRIGDFRLLPSERVLAFMRRTDRVAETTIVVANPTDEIVVDVLPARDSKLMNAERLADELGEGQAKVTCGVITVEIPPRTVWVLRPVMRAKWLHDPYKRVQ